MRRFALLVAFAAFGAFAAVACTDFAPVTRGVCGNGLLEEGEDCDSIDPSCVRCAVTCSAKSDCPTADYECGVDGLCHAPGGGLSQPRAAGVFQADELHITDVDHDGIGDALGLSRTSIVVRHGDATARLSALDSIVTPTQTGPAAFGDLDGDGSLDLALTTADGLVAYASSYGELVPVAVNSGLTDESSGDPLDLRAFVRVAPRVIAGFLVEPTSDAILMIVIDSTGGATGNPVFVQPCVGRLGAIPSASFDVASIDVYNVTTDGKGQLDTMISFTVVGAPPRACVLSLHRSAPAAFQAFPIVAVADVTPAAFSAAAKRPVLADLDTDADPCPGVIRPDAGIDALVYFDGSRASATAPCTLATAPTALPALGAPPTAELVGRVPVVPNVPLVAADGLVTSEGLYPYLPAGIPVLSPSPQFTVVYRTTRRIAKVDHGDLDGDGNVDVVLAAAGEQDLDFLFRVPTQAGFNLVRVDTASAVTHLLIGDYDGNRIADVAFTEAYGDHERMLVAFGTPDRPLAPAPVGVFPGVLSLSRIGFPDTIDYLGLADDVIVLARPAAGSTTLRMSLLHGSPQRTLLSYFDPRPDATRSETLFRGAVVGHFVAGGAGELRDLVAIAPPTAASAGVPGKDIVRAWRMPGTPDGVDATASPGIVLDGLVDCSLGRSGRLCLDTARYLAFPAGEQRDVVIGVDRGNAAVMIDPWATAVTATRLDALTAAIPSGSQVHALHAADLDGDGDAELVAAFAPTTSASRGAVIACAMDAGVPVRCDDLVPGIVEAAVASGSPVTRCLDAAPARLGYRGARTGSPSGRDLAVLCHGDDGTTIFRVQWSDAGIVVDRLATTGAELHALRAGDVTGDRVDDLVLLEGKSVTSLVVYPQCTSREVGTCRGEEESP